MLHGDECTLMKGHSFVERMQINMIFPAALHILYLINFLLLLLVGGREGGLLLYCMQPGLFTEIYVMSAVITFYSVIVQF